MAKIYQNIKQAMKSNDTLFVVLKNMRDYCYLFLNKISHYQLEKNRFYKEVGYPLNIKFPQSFNEKIIWKKIHDRNPLLPITADKYEVRSYIQKVLGEERAKEILIPLLYVTDQPETIPFESLPPNFIIKPNHASGKNIIVKNGSLNQQEIIRTCQRWLKTSYGMEKLEWAYQPIKRKIIIEELLLDDGNTPKDFKFHMFHGKCKLIYVTEKRSTHPLKSFYDDQWNYLLIQSGANTQEIPVQKPKNYETMLLLAEELSKAFDYVRVDLYNVDGKIYFGEFTHYPKSGTRKFEPNSLDFEYGNYWKIEIEYWKEKNINLLAIIKQEK